jgi:threonine dehydrogenase-like Zn-dependent dehydrogenase
VNRALVYGARPGTEPGPRVEPRAPSADVDAAVLANLLAQPLGLYELGEIEATAEAVVCAPRLAGVCGSDTRLMLGDFSEGDIDNPMAAFSALPFVLGHEVVADVVATAGGSDLGVGDRVVLNAWLSCVPRGLDRCAACERGDLAQCERFLDGAIGPGLHVGVAAGAPGAFASRFSAHPSQLHLVPEAVSDAAAVLADPFSVSLHAISRTAPPQAGRALVIGAGALGTMAVAILRRMRPDVEVAVLCRYAHQREAVTRLGAHLAVGHEPRDEALAELAQFAGTTLRPALDGLAMSYPGGVDVVYDTVGSAATLELAVRIARMRGSVVLLGVATPQRFEWTPIYFKELTVRGSSGFGVETLDGQRRHAIDHYLAACRDGLDLAWLVTHTDSLEGYLDVCAALTSPERSGVIKAACAPND